MPKPKKTFLLSVYDKTGLKESTTRIKALGFDLLASDDTHKWLAGQGIQSRNVAEIIGPPILGHKVVTLSREIHAGLLADPNNPEEMAELEKLGIPLISGVYCNLYPLGDIPEGVKQEEALARIDVDGPALLRSAAKGLRLVAHNKRSMETILLFLEKGFKDNGLFRMDLASEAEFHVSQYCSRSSDFYDLDEKD